MDRDEAYTKWLVEWNKPYPSDEASAWDAAWDLQQKEIERLNRVIDKMPHEGWCDSRMFSLPCNCGKRDALREQ